MSSYVSDVMPIYLSWVFPPEVEPCAIEPSVSEVESLVAACYGCRSASGYRAREWDVSDLRQLAHSHVLLRTAGRRPPLQKLAYQKLRIQPLI